MADDGDEVVILRGSAVDRFLGLLGGGGGGDGGDGGDGDDGPEAPEGFEFDDDGYLRKIAKKADGATKKAAGATKKRGFFDPR